VKRCSYNSYVRIAITSDIHANLAALEAVLADAGPVDGIWNTGDAVGYGPQPRECIARLREVGAVWVAGNHERAATGAISTDEFNPAAAQAAQWTAEQISREEKTFLDALPEIVQEANFTLCHGTLRDPIWEYCDDEYAALAHLLLQRTPFGLVGHTHVPLLITETPDGCELERLSDGEVVALTGEVRLVLNPGSVGQPRDGDKRASYGVFDSDAATFTLRRVEYVIARTQKLMVDAGLPDWLVDRLAIGR
jgi:diadenosine tetraphosphatase ApaH/serine/threonine PP2A family protein phosphatase